MLKIKPFDVPDRPCRMDLLSLRRILTTALVLGMLGYLTGSWVSLALIFYACWAEGWFAFREWRWHRYADKCEATFVQIGESVEELGEQIERIALEIEARQTTTQDYATEPSTATSATWTGYWAAPSKGQH